MKEYYKNCFPVQMCQFTFTPTVWDHLFSHTILYLNYFDDLTVVKRILYMYFEKKCYQMIQPMFVSLFIFTYWVNECMFSYRTEFALKEIMSSGGAEDDIPQGERKTVTDFCYLLDKSKQLFNGLRLVSLDALYFSLVLYFFFPLLMCSMFLKVMDKMLDKYLY